MHNQFLIDLFNLTDRISQFYQINNTVLIMGINANKKVKRAKVRVSGNKNSSNNWNINTQGWNAIHKAFREDAK